MKNIAFCEHFVVVVTFIYADDGRYPYFGHYQLHQPAILRSFWQTLIFLLLLLLLILLIFSILL